jgi:hypothetical protein
MDLEAREKKQQKRLRKEKRKEPDSSLSNALDNPHSRARSPEGYRAVPVIFSFPLRRLKLTACPLTIRASPAHRPR